MQPLTVIYPFSRVISLLNSCFSIYNNNELIDDTQVMLAALENLGVKMDWEDDGKVLVLEGTAGKFRENSEIRRLYVRFKKNFFFE